MRYVVMCLVVLSLTACTTTGKEVKQEQLSHFVKGKTTYAQVVKELGEPNGLEVHQDGSKSAIYMSEKFDPKAYIPFVGGFIAGPPSATNVVLYFNKKSVLTDAPSK